MINVSIKRSNDILEEVHINGHAGYDESGKDIVCAGVSSILITTVNAILEFDEEAISFVEGNNFSLNNLKKDEITNKLLNNMYLLLKELKEQYSENIDIKEE